MTTYELWFHDLVGTYGVRLGDGQVTGVCGPLLLGQTSLYDPARLRYDDRPEAIRFVRNQPEHLCLGEAWQKVAWVSAPAARRRRLPRVLAWLRAR